MRGILDQMDNYQISEEDSTVYSVFFLFETFAPLKAELLVINIILIIQFVLHRKNITSPLQ
jgi:hypothetical protein